MYLSDDIHFSVRAFQLFIGRYNAYIKPFKLLLFRGRRMIFPPLQLLQPQKFSYLTQPCTYRAVTIEAAERLDCLTEGFLCKLLSCIGLTADTKKIGVDLLTVLVVVFLNIPVQRSPSFLIFQKLLYVSTLRI